MENKYKMAVVLNLIPALVNLAGSVFVFVRFSGFHFSGYFAGTVLGILLSALWLFQVRKAFGSHAIKLLKITFKGFFIKFILFVLFITLFYSIFHFSRTYFAVSFFIAVTLSAIIELWFYSSLTGQKS